MSKKYWGVWRGWEGRLFGAETRREQCRDVEQESLNKDI